MNLHGTPRKVKEIWTLYLILLLQIAKSIAGVAKRAMSSICDFGPLAFDSDSAAENSRQPDPLPARDACSHCLSSSQPLDFVLSLTIMARRCNMFMEYGLPETTGSG